MMKKEPSQQQPQRNPRGKYITLAILLAWVLAVFLFTLFKFSGGPK